MGWKKKTPWHEGLKGFLLLLSNVKLWSLSFFFLHTNLFHSSHFSLITYSMKTLQDLPPCFLFILTDIHPLGLRSPLATLPSFSPLQCLIFLIYSFFFSLSLLSPADVLQCKKNHGCGSCNLSSPSLLALSSQPPSLHFSFPFINDLLWLSLIPLTPACCSCHAPKNRMMSSVKHHFSVIGPKTQYVAFCYSMWRESERKKISWKHVVKLRKGFHFRGSKVLYGLLLFSHM